jgi:hypothetical protein
MLGYLRNNPLLAGCLGLMGCLGLVLVFAVGVAGLGLKAALNISQVAVFDARGAAMSAGFGFGYFSDNGSVSLDLLPHEPREVSCDELWQLIEPHILQPDEPLTLRSQTTVLGEDGAVTVVSLECVRVSVDTAGNTPGESGSADQDPPTPSALDHR